jgi:peptide/nickel transport system substrate-binding protein
MARSNSKELTGPSVWNCYCTAWTGLNASSPGTFIPLYGQAPDPEMEALKDAWFDAPDLAAQKQIADRMQLRALDAPPFLPLGEYYRPQAHRTALTGIVPSSPYSGTCRRRDPRRVADADIDRLGESIASTQSPGDVLRAFG